MHINKILNQLFKFVLISLIISSFSYMQITDVKQKEKYNKNGDWKHFKEKYIIRQSYFSNNGVPKLLSGENLSPPNAIGTPEDIGYQFFEENKNLYRIGNPKGELRVNKIITDDEYNLVHIKYQQYYKGIEVRGSISVVHMNKNNEIRSINSDYIPDIDLNVIPTISKNSAEQIAIQEIAVTNPTIKNTELQIFTRDNENILTWSIKIHDKLYSSAWEYIIDANTGNFIRKYSLVKH